MDVDGTEPIVFSGLPRLQELCHVVVSIDTKEPKDSSVKSDFQWQLLKTRILLFSDANVVACPMSGELRFIHVVCKYEYYTRGSLVLLLDKNRLKVETVNRLQKEIYEESLLYYVISKLAPSWNRVEKMFVGGRYFLMMRGQLSAVELNFLTSDDKLLLYIYPLRLWLREVDLLDFDLPMEVLEHCVSERFYKDLSHEPQWVHVLPSFKRGRIVYVTNRIPEQCTFKDYQQMRRHWKNTYGYRLPEDDTTITYVGVNFFGTLNFTYPTMCVRRGMHYNIGDPKLIHGFTNDFIKNVSVICGSRLQLVKMNVPTHPYFKAETNEKWNEKDLLSIEKHVLENFISMPLDNVDQLNTTQISLCPEPQSYNGYGHSENSDFHSPNIDEWFIKCSNFIDGLAQIEPKRSKVRPLNKPLFMKRPRLFMNKKLRRKNEQDEERDEKVEERQQEDYDRQGQDVPNETIYNDTSNRHGLKVIIPRFKANISSGIPPTDALPNSNLQPSKVLQTNQVENLNHSDANLRVSEIYKPLFNKPKKDSIKCTSKSTPLKNKKIPNPINDFNESQLSKNSQPHPKIKSERKKPQTFNDNDIHKLNKAGKLNKVNTASLLLFLKKNGVKCKTSDKKGVLVEKTQLLLSQEMSKT